MSMQASTVEILINKAHFEPPVALAVAEAIDNETRCRDLVTVPVLDARLERFKRELHGELDERFAETRVRFADLRTELVRWVFVAVMGQTALLSGIMYFLLQITH